MSVYRILRPLKTNILARCSRSKRFPLCLLRIRVFPEPLSVWKNDSLYAILYPYIRVQNAICRHFLQPSGLWNCCVVSTSRIVTVCGIVYRHWTNLYCFIFKPCIDMTSLNNNQLMHSQFNIYLKHIKSSCKIYPDMFRITNGTILRGSATDPS